MTLQAAKVDERPHVLFVGGFPPPGSTVTGGVITSCRLIMQSSFAERVRVTSFDTTMRSVPPPGLPTRLLDAVRRVRDFARALREVRPNAALLLCGNDFSFIEKALLARYARWRGVPSVLAPRGAGLMDQLRGSSLRLAFGRWLFHGASRVMCQSEIWREFVVGDMQVPESRFAVVANWTAAKELTAIGDERIAHEARGEQLSASPTITLLFMGWLDESKGLFDLLDAMRLLADRLDVPAHRLCIAGGGESESRARQRVADLGLEHVEFMGWLHDEAKLDMLRSADVFVLPSWHEGMPNAMIEAMACGLPVIVTPVGSVPDVVTDGYDAMLVPVRDTGALSNALHVLLTDASLRTTMGRNAYTTASSRFSVEPAADRLVALIGGLVGAT